MWVEDASLNRAAFLRLFCLWVIVQWNLKLLYYLNCKQKSSVCLLIANNFHCISLNTVLFDKDNLYLNKSSVFLWTPCACFYKYNIVAAIILMSLFFHFLICDPLFQLLARWVVCIEYWGCESMKKHLLCREQHKTERKTHNYSKIVQSFKVCRCKENLPTKSCIRSGGICSGWEPTTAKKKTEKDE